MLSTESILRKLAADRTIRVNSDIDLTETIRLSMDSVDNRILHAWYTTVSVDSTDKINGITPVWIG